EFRVASPPEFKGEAGVWTPEDLFVAAVNVCTMTTFAAFAQRLNLPVLSYRCEAEGPFTLHPEEIERGGWFAPDEVTRWIAEKPHEFASGFVLIWRRLNQAK
ncbi:MAG: OsmC family protein, partial [Pedosphaera parvula]|nr:OsmC family protein [Pedosphaera parvula]